MTRQIECLVMRPVIGDRKMKFLCKLFGCIMFFDESIGGSSTCRRCGHKEPGIDWDRPGAPMPPVKPPKADDAI